MIQQLIGFAFSYDRFGVGIFVFIIHTRITCSVHKPVSYTHLDVYKRQNIYYMVQWKQNKDAN